MKNLVSRLFKKNIEEPTTKLPIILDPENLVITIASNYLAKKFHTAILLYENQIAIIGGSDFEEMALNYIISAAYKTNDQYRIDTYSRKLSALSNDRVIAVEQS